MEEEEGEFLGGVGVLGGSSVVYIFFRFLGSRETVRFSFGFVWVGKDGFLEVSVDVFLCCF